MPAVTPATPQPLSPEMKLAALLQLTGDLDKADVLHQKIPSWMYKAKPQVLAQMEDNFKSAGPYDDKVRRIFARLKSLKRFCVETLTAALLSEYGVSLNVESDELWIKRAHVKVDAILPHPQRYVTYSVEKQTLLEAAMRNFSEDETRTVVLAPNANIHQGGTPTVVVDISAAGFVRFCRKLNLGDRYQKHLKASINLLTPQAQESVYNPDATDIKRLKVHEMRTDVFIAYSQGVIGVEAYGMLLALTHNGEDITREQVEAVRYRDTPLVWQGLKILDACIWGVVVFSAEPIDKHPQTPCVVYMPGDLYRPLYEYTSFEAFQTYLSDTLKVQAYAQSFSRYLDEEIRLDFYKELSSRSSLGVIDACPMTKGLFQFFFESLIGKMQKDARILAVPTEDIDEQAREERRLGYLSTGLTIANIAGLFVPVIGQLMMGVAIGQMLGEVYDGVEDWQHKDKVRAFEHLRAVVDGLADMVLFSAGVSVGGAVKRSFTRSLEFFDSFEAVQSVNGQRRLWRSTLMPYQHPMRIGSEQLSDAEVVYNVDGLSFIKHTGQTYRVAFDPEIDSWRIRHPVRSDAFAPPVEHNGAGGWKHIYERPEDWGALYTLGRLEPRIEAVEPRRLEQALIATGTEVEPLRQLAGRNLRLPASFNDCAERFRLDHTISELITQLESRSTATVASDELQLKALPLMREWPEGRYIKVLDDTTNEVVRYPAEARVDETLSIHVARDQLGTGNLLRTVVDGLSAQELDTLLGNGVTGDKSRLLAARLARSLKANRQPLFNRLYQEYDQPVGGWQALLAEQVPGLPVRVAQALIENASSVDRSYLRYSRKVPLSLSQAAKEAQAGIRLDRINTSFYLPALADAQTWRLSTQLLPHMPGWPAKGAVQLREGSLKGPLLASAEAPGAEPGNVVVQTGTHFQAYGVAGQKLGEGGEGGAGFYQALLQAMPAEQRAALGVSVPSGVNAELLRYRLFDVSSTRRADALWAFEGKPRRLVPSCVQADSPLIGTAIHYTRSMVRKVRKLYPEFTDRQVDEFLKGLGNTDLERARALEQRHRQKAILDRTLKDWVSEEVTVPRQGGSPHDYRQSRQQVADRLRDCWSQMTRAKSYRQISYPGLVLDDMRVGRLPIWPADMAFDHVQILSLRNMALESDVAYFLKAFKSVRELRLDGSQIRWLPEVLSHMPKLESLSLANNRINLSGQAALKLAAMSNLHTLNLAKNPLGETPDVSAMKQLRKLNLSETRARELPSGLLTRLHLESAMLEGNDIVELPEALFSAPIAVTEKIHLSHNPVSSRSLAKLKAYQQRTGVGMGLMDDEIGMLSEQFAREALVQGDSAATYLQRQDTWQKLRDEWNSEAFFSVIRQMTRSNEFRQVPVELRRRVWGVLDAAAKDHKLRDFLFSLPEGLPNCIDGAAYCFSEMEVAVLLDQAVGEAGLIQPDQLDVATQLKLGRQLFRMAQLDMISDDYSLRNKVIDKLQVRLVYRSRLAETLDLPGQSSNIAYQHVGGVSDEDIQEAVQQVTTREMSSSLATFIADQSYWLEYLRRQYVTEFQAVEDRFSTRLDTLSVNDDSYLDDTVALQVERRASLDSLANSLTQDALETVERLAQACSV